MKRFIINIIFLFALIQAHSQTPNVDALYEIWSDTNKSAEARVEAFYQRFNPLKDETTNQEAIRWSWGIKEVQTKNRQEKQTNCTESSTQDRSYP